MPRTPGLQTHRPDICSQSDRTEPFTLQSHATEEQRERKSVKEKRIAWKYDWLNRKFSQRYGSLLQRERERREERAGKMEHSVQGSHKNTRRQFTFALVCNIRRLRREKERNMVTRKYTGENAKRSRHPPLTTSRERERERTSKLTYSLCALHSSSLHSAGRFIMKTVTS